MENIKICILQQNHKDLELPKCFIWIRAKKWCKEV